MYVLDKLLQLYLRLYSQQLSARCNNSAGRTLYAAIDQNIVVDIPNIRIYVCVICHFIIALELCNLHSYVTSQKLPVRAIRQDIFSPLDGISQ